MSVDPTTRHSMRDSLGIAAIAGLAVLCCAGPALLAAGALGGLGAWLLNPWLIGAAALLALGREHRAGVAELGRAGRGDGDCGEPGGHRLDHGLRGRRGDRADLQLDINVSVAQPPSDEVTDRALPLVDLDRTDRADAAVVESNPVVDGPLPGVSGLVDVHLDTGPAAGLAEEVAHRRRVTGDGHHRDRVAQRGPVG